MMSIWRRAPDDKSTGYWGVGMLLIGSGILIVTENAGALNPWKLMLGNGSIVLGAVCHWWGLQFFYRRRCNQLGLWLVAAFLLLFSLTLVLETSTRTRSLLVSCFVLLALLAWIVEVWSGQRGRHIFASRLVLFATSVLVLIYLVRVALLVIGARGNMTATPDIWQVALLYFAPLACMMLVGAGLMLLYLERIIAENRRLANVDALTGLLNRGAIVTAGERALADALQHGTALTVAMLDIDFFKAINDNLGHDAGDEVLVDLARLLKTHCRQQDLVGRYGGEEFCILFPDMDETTSADVAARIMDTVRGYRYRQSHSLTVSIGLAVLAHTQDGTTSWDQLIKAADQQLYLAKRNGRNQCQRTVFSTAHSLTGRRTMDGTTRS
ncbi:MAG: GGDEF domain-containing protein [Herbaspirillum sp.]